LRVLPAEGLQYLSPDALQTLTSSVFTVDAQSDRMGLRLSGGRLNHAGTHELISSAIPAGAIQVPSSGEPIVLMADRQTTGGYPIAATVITADFGRAGQLAPGDPVQFAVCTRQEAMAALLVLEQALLALEGGAR
jgi:allophanate hydrolase subunit 2